MIDFLASGVAKERMIQERETPSKGNRGRYVIDSYQAAANQVSVSSTRCIRQIRSFYRFLLQILRPDRHTIRQIPPLYVLSVCHFKGAEHRSYFSPFLVLQPELLPSQFNEFVPCSISY